MKKILLFIMVLFVPLCLFAQNKADPDKKTDWWGDIDGYINQQDKVTLDMVTDELKKNPPTIVEPEIRKMALLMIDNVLHEEKAPQRPAVQNFFLRQIEKAVEEIRTVDVLMTNSWAYYPEQRLAKGFRPGLIIPGHENELGHTIDHREPFWLNYVRLSGPLSFQWVQMAWGEKFQYIPVTK